MTSQVRPIYWSGDLASGTVVMLDQRYLPGKELYNHYSDPEGVADAIRTMVIRGAPAIGIAAAMGVVLGIRSVPDSGEGFNERLESVGTLLAATRPTAVNLFWAIDRMKQRAKALTGLTTPELKQGLLDEANLILTEDIETNRSIGKHGAEVVPNNATILTHCNTGALATGGYGTALGVVRAAVEAGKKIRVFADETRPFLQGARLTTWELIKDNIPVTLITDNMAASFFASGAIDLVIVGTDRTVANGDVANKIGTYGVAVLAKYHNVPFYVAAPTSTIDLSITDGKDIPIEQRPIREVTHIGDHRLTPEGADILNPAFDVTPADLVTGIITENGIARAPYLKSLNAMVNG